MTMCKPIAYRISAFFLLTETIVQRRLDPTPIKVTHGTYVFVAIDDDGKPRQVPKGDA